MSDARVTASAKPAKPSPNPGPRVLGKSEATGGKVLSPIGKGASVSLARVMATVAALESREKQ